MTPPNFLVIVADDLGFSDCGCFGSEIQTPNIDALSREHNALRFTNFHVAAACSPTRSMLMTGTDHHIAGLGELAEFTRSSAAHQGQPGHEGYLNERVVALPELLQDGGYHTMMAGKWHLGLKPQHYPVRRGFDKSFALLPGCANHYGYEPQYEEQDHADRFFETATRALHVEGSQIAELPDNFYSSDAYASKLIGYLSGRDEAEIKKPFFAYLPFSAPHWPLQAPKEVADRYQGMYQNGPQALKSERIERLKKLGLVDQDVVSHPIVRVGEQESQEWEDLPEETRQSSARAMEVYAGMVDRMDWNIGRVVNHLRKTGEYDNTMILFMSDNGAEGASYEAQPIMGDKVAAHIAKYYDNSLENIGRGDSFVWYGALWAQAATAPSRLFKMHSTEGGCRVPLVVKPPKRTEASGSRITKAYCTVMDIVPTFLEMAGLRHPGTHYRGREIASLRGKSWQPYLQSLHLENEGKKRCKDEEFDIHDETYVTGFEIAGSGALRQGHWKLVFVPAPRGPQKWELFHMKNDPGETKNLCYAEPAKFAELMRLWEEYKAEVGSIGVAGEFPEAVQGQRVSLDDEFADPYSWIKFIGRPKLVPGHLSHIRPVMDPTVLVVTIGRLLIQIQANYNPFITAMAFWTLPSGLLAPAPPSGSSSSSQTNSVPSLSSRHIQLHPIRYAPRCSSILAVSPESLHGSYLSAKLPLHHQRIWCRNRPIFENPGGALSLDCPPLPGEPQFVHGHGASGDWPRCDHRSRLWPRMIGAIA
ncbi:arylsulfatase [Cordyceps militaris CM01]|uniref:Arylsulfatase n=1 Tax=Cordyceps militaris (strain CM01) TaxID=983644 RepID=G3JRE4_CORMM|nr:arylsulfatase [Cordyceps militaris CM01]EGX88494.1 arylsulfatase [Cordyceps militaris CM01]